MLPDRRCSNFGRPVPVWEYMATVAIPISLQARMIRTAISPRLAINILENMVYAPVMAKENSADTQSFPSTVTVPSAK